jgi:hypothetical protein
MKILAIGLGKFNSVACLLDTANNQSEFKVNLKPSPLNAGLWSNC